AAHLGALDRLQVTRADDRFRPLADRLRQLVGDLLLDRVPVNGPAAGACTATRNQHHHSAGQGNRDGNSHVLRPIFRTVTADSCTAWPAAPVHADSSPIAFLARASVGAARSCA